MISSSSIVTEYIKHSSDAVETTISPLVREEGEEGEEGIDQFHKIRYFLLSRVYSAPLA